MWLNGQPEFECYFLDTSSFTRGDCNCIPPRVCRDINCPATRYLIYKKVEKPKKIILKHKKFKLNDW